MEEVKEQFMVPVVEKPEMVVEERLGLHGVEEVTEKGVQVQVAVEEEG